VDIHFRSLQYGHMPLLCTASIQSCPADPMTLTYATAATQYVQAGATRYAYRRVGRDSGVPLLFLQSFRQGMDSTDPSLLDGFAGSAGDRF